MRFLLPFLGLLALASFPASGQDPYSPDPYADPSPPPPALQTVQPALPTFPAPVFPQPSTMTASPLAVFGSLKVQGGPETMTLLRMLASPATTNAQLNLALSQASAEARGQVLSALATAPAQASVALSALATRGALSATLNGVDVSTLQQLLLAIAAAPTSQSATALVQVLSAQGTLAASLQTASPENVRALLLAVASTPETAQLLLQTLDNAKLLSLLEGLQQKLDTLQLGQIDALEGEVLVAVSQYALTDTRFPRIASYSPFGRKLAAVQRKIKDEGMTPENRAALVSVYRDATQALQSFLAAEKAEQGETTP